MKIPVCALCHEDIGAGMKVTIWPPRQFSDYLVATNRSPLKDMDNPVVTCLPCGMRVKVWRAQVKPQ
jgi:hypothetical protein